MNTTIPSKLTQCPHCQNVFDISDEEMQLALGAVRCGECMKIFNANYHLVDSSKGDTSSVHNPSLENENKTDDLTDQPIQSTNIPTLQEYPQTSLPTSQLTPEENDFTSIDSLLKTDKASFDEVEQSNDNQPTDNTDKEPQKKLTKPFIAGLFALVAAILVGSWIFTNSVTSNYYQFTEVRLSPSSDPKKVDIHFKLINTSQQNLALPNLTIQLLNLSSQPISSEIITSNELQTNLTELKAGASQALTVSVNRPSTFVQTALIQEYLEDSKL